MSNQDRVSAGSIRARVPTRDPESVAADTAWSALSANASLSDLAQPWLILQIRQAGAAGGGIFVRDDAMKGTTFRPLHVKGVSSTTLQDVATRVIERGAPVLDQHTEGACAFVGHPLQDGAVVFGAVILQVEEVTPQRLRNVARALAWGAAWLREAQIRERAAVGDRRALAMRTAHEIFAAAMEHHRARPAALDTVTRLVRLVSADRVSLGFRRLGRSHVAAVSHSAEFDKRMSLNRHVSAAMDEAIDQRAALTHPAPDNEINTTRVHSELSRDHGPSSILTLPFRVADAHRGAVTMERAPDRPFTAEEIGFLDFTVSLVGPVLWEKRQNDKWLIFKISDTVGTQFIRLLGPGYVLRKSVILCLVVLVALFAMWTQPYRVTADARVEGATQRAIVAPFDGFIREAPYRAGDSVAQGALLVALDDRDLALERLRWVTKRTQKVIEYDRALGDQDRSQAQIARAEIAQAEAQIELIDAQIDRTRLAAPFDGLVVAGDLSQNVGGSVSRGEVLFEIAPHGDFRVVLFVDEARISEVTRGGTGELLLTALPDQAFPFTVDKITPVAVAEEGENRFRVEARLTGETPEIGPGMEGVAKIDVDDRLTIQIWTRELVDWAQLKLWTWFG